LKKSEDKKIEEEWVSEKYKKISPIFYRFHGLLPLYVLHSAGKSAKGTSKVSPEKLEEENDIQKKKANW
jgi:hypothetical protein